MVHVHLKEVDEKELEFLKKNFTCIHCGKCCEMKVVINSYDIKKIEDNGYKDFYEKDVLGRYVLKMINNRCIFFKENEDGLHCEIYNFRPKGCEQFPFFYNYVMECPSLD